MTFVSHALEWVRPLLSGSRTPDKHSLTLAPVAPSADRKPPTPDVWGARLIAARKRRWEQQTRPAQKPQRHARAAWFSPRPWEATDAMVRPYVARLREAPRRARTGAQANPWGDAR
jgi:hypothetical protein